MNCYHVEGRLAGEDFWWVSTFFLACYQDCCITFPPYHSIGLIDTISLITSQNSWGYCLVGFFLLSFKSYRKVKYLKLNDNIVVIIAAIIY